MIGSVACRGGTGAMACRSGTLGMMACANGEPPPPCDYDVHITFQVPAGTGTVDYSSTSGESGSIDATVTSGDSYDHQHIDDVWTVTNNSDRPGVVQIQNNGPSDLCVNGVTVPMGATFSFLPSPSGPYEQPAIDPGDTLVITITCGACP
jgi:hypothetical protein